MTAPAPLVAPSNLDAERSVIGGILLHARLLALVAGLVDPADFYHPAHQAIFAAMVALDAAGKPVDPITVAEQMRASETLSVLRAFSGESYFSELTAAVVVVVEEHIASHARTVRGKALARRLIEAAQEIAAKGYGEYGDVEDYLAESEQALLAVTSGLQSSRPQLLSHVAVQALDAIAERVERLKSGELATGISLGLPGLDELLGGFVPTRQYVVAGRPGSGKSAFVLQAVARAVASGAAAALVFTLEMLPREQVERMIADSTGLHGARLQRGWLDVPAMGRIAASIGRFGDWPLEFEGNRDVTLRQIRSTARAWAARMRRKYPRRRLLVALDYLQLVEGDDAKKDKTREREIARISRGTKKLAGEIDAATVIVSQLNRALEQGEKPRRPRLSDLRESGAIEQDADAVLFLHETGDDTTEAIIAKHRHGPVGEQRLRFRKEVSRFEEAAPVMNGSGYIQEEADA